MPGRGGIPPVGSWSARLRDDAVVDNNDDDGGGDSHKPPPLRHSTRSQYSVNDTI